MIKGTLLLEAVSLNPTAIIDLYAIDTRPIGGSSVFYFHPGNKIDGTDVAFAGVLYAQWPVEAKGFEWTTTGTQPRPTVSFGNVTGAFTALNLQFGGLTGAKLSRTRTFAKFLDGMPQADASAAFPSEAWNINKKTQEDREICVYELSNPMDLEDLQLPRRLVMADTCQWQYRGDGCGYSDFNLADQNDNRLPYYPWTGRGPWQAGVYYNYGDMVQLGYDPPQIFVCVYPNVNAQPPYIGNSNYWWRDECSLRLTGCNIRFGRGTRFNGLLFFGGFPGTRMQPIASPT